MTLPEATSRAAYRLVVPWRVSSWVARWGVPGSSGSTGAVRSSACTWVFSSTHSTRAAWGGLRYSPTMSRTLSMNCGSVESLNASVRCGLSPNARQIRLTAVWFMPQRPRQRPGRPMGGIGGGGLQGGDDDPFDVLVGELARGARAGFVDQSLQPAGHEPRAPLDDRGPGHAELLGDLGVGSTLSAGQHDPAALGQRLAGGPPPGPALQGRALLVSQRQLGELGASAARSDVRCGVHPWTRTNRPRTNDSGH